MKHEADEDDIAKTAVFVVFLFSGILLLPLVHSVNHSRIVNPVVVECIFVYGLEQGQPRMLTVQRTQCMGMVHALGLALGGRGRSSAMVSAC
mmetsp:Transcript_11517/g.20818  ORF Transcript_11517/g.20818 Transcript_11517/m.20818 type:complete len:92 (-) Transcript_11517:947-1222(-)